MIRNAFMKITCLVLLICLFSQQAYAADPRSLLSNARKFFAGIDEERASRRSSTEFVDAESRKLAMIDNKNAAYELAVKPGTPSDGSDEDLSPHSDYSDVRELDAVKPIVIPVKQGDTLAAVVKGEAVVVDKSHPLSKEIEWSAKNAFRAVGSALIEMAQTAYQFGTYNFYDFLGAPPRSSQYLMLESNPLNLVAKGFASLTMTQKWAALAAQALKSGDLQAILKPIANVMHSVNQVADAAEFKAFNDRWAPYYGGPLYDYPSYNELAFLPTLFNANEAGTAYGTYLQTGDYQPVADLFGKYGAFAPVADIPGMSSYLDIVKHAVNFVRDASNAFAWLLAEAKTAYEASAQTSQDLLKYDNAKKQAKSSYQDSLKQAAVLYESAAAVCQNVLIAASYTVGTKVGGVVLPFSGNNGSFYDANEGYLAYRYGPVTLDVFSGRSALLKETTKHVSNRFADYSGLSKTWPVVSIKVMETGKPAYWEIRDKVTQALVMTLAVPGSEELSQNTRPLNLDNVLVKERYENGKLVRIDVTSTVDYSSFIILKDPEKDAILYDPFTGGVSQGIIVDRDLVNEDPGFRITMKDGKVEELFLNNNALYGKLHSILGGMADSYEIFHQSIGGMIREARKYPVFIQFQQDFEVGTNTLQGLAPSSNLEGALIEPLKDSVVHYGIDGIETITHFQDGTYFANKGNASDPKDKFASARITFSPSPVGGGDVFLRILTGEVGNEIAFLENPFLGVTQTHGIFNLGSGVIQSLPDLGDLQAGSYTAVNDIGKLGGNFKLQTFLEKDMEGAQWVGIAIEYI